MRFTHLVFDGVADGPLGVGLDVVASAARLLTAGLVATASVDAPRQRVVSTDGQPVTSRAGRRVEVDGALSVRSVRAGDVLVVPGLGAASERELAATIARPDVALGVSALTRAAAGGATVAASCSSTFLLAEARLLEGREATTTWWLSPLFSRRYPGVTLRADRMVVDAGPVVTAGAALAHADLLLALVARHAGPALAHLLARYLVLDERPSQARYMLVDHLRTEDPVVRRLEQVVIARIDEQLSLAQMARACATSPRTLARRVERALGTTPHHFAQRLRIERAVHLLETTGRPVEQIACDVGYADAAAFRRVFRRETGGSPLARRQQSRGGGAPEVTRSRAAR